MAMFKKKSLCLVLSAFALSLCAAANSTAGADARVKNATGVANVPSVPSVPRVAANTTRSTLEEDDENFDFSVFDKTPAQRKRNGGNTQDKLADSIVKAVQTFIQSRSNTFSLATLLSQYRARRSAPDDRELDFSETSSRPSAADLSFDDFPATAETAGSDEFFGDDSILLKAIDGSEDSAKSGKDDFNSENLSGGKRKIDPASLKVLKDYFSSDKTAEQSKSDDFGKEDKRSGKSEGRVLSPLKGAAKTTTESSELIDFDDFDSDSEEERRGAEDAAVFKELNDKISADKELGFPLDFDESQTIEPGVSSYIDKIPRRAAVLSRQAKSLEDGGDAAGDVPGDVLRQVRGVEAALEVYSARGLAAHWAGAAGVRERLGAACAAPMALLLRGLATGEKWALKVDDASGRYTAGYYWGNGYWAGSATLCEHLSREPPRDAVTNRSRNYGHSDGIGIQAGAGTAARPPFPLAFFMARLQLNGSVADGGPHIVHLGLCLPANCSAEDVRGMLEGARAPADPLVLQVRAPAHDRYDMLQDLTFQILAAVSAVVLGLMIAGTLYEVALGPRLQRTSSPPAALTPVLPTVKMANGKSIYSLNAMTNNNNNNSEERLNIDMPVTDEAIQLNVFSELILSFSVISNIRTICDQSVGSDTLSCIHGLRSASMAWVILGHTCIIAFKYSDNTELRKVVEKEFLFQTVTNGSFSVDTFFCISGILVSYLYFRTNAKGSLERLTQGTRGIVSGILQFIGLLAYRFARLTAPYMFMLGVVEVSMKWFHHNSIFETPTQDHINCPNYWWRNVLYINTLFPVEQMCMLWSWYLADDTQFYVVGAVILILAASRFKTAAVVLGMFLVSSWATTGYIAWSHNHMPSSDDPLALFDKIYDKPWTRLGPYLVGMAAGWLLFKTDCRIRMSKVAVSLGWLFSTLVLLCLVYGLYDTELTPITAAAYSSLSHTAWALAISWIVIACSTGHGGYVNSMLSATILYPFSRVTYCAYLVHPVVIRFLAMHMDHPIHLGKDIMTIIFLGQMVASYILSFIISLAFEAPVVTMLKILAPNRRKKIQ